jgi:hypothetical protein
MDEMSIFKKIYVEKWVLRRWDWSKGGKVTKYIFYHYGKFPDEFYEGAD